MGVEIGVMWWQKGGGVGRFSGAWVDYLTDKGGENIGAAGGLYRRGAVLYRRGECIYRLLWQKIIHFLGLDER